MKKSEPKSRRKFLRQASAGTLAAGAANIITSKTHGAPRVIQLESEPEPQRTIGPNDKIRFGLIGAGGMGHGDTETALRVKGVEFVAAADIYDGRLTHVKEVWGKDIFTTRDYREVLARPDIDAVIIATPDHWHQRIAIDAMNAGKLKAGNFFNLGIGQGYSVKQVVEAARRVTGHAIPCKLGPRRPGDPPQLFANADKIRNAIGWRAKRTNLDETVATAWRWYKAHPDGYGD